MIPIAFIRETTEKSISLVEEGPEKHQWDKGKERKKDERKKEKKCVLCFISSMLLISNQLTQATSERPLTTPDKSCDGYFRN